MYQITTKYEKYELMRVIWWNVQEYKIIQNNKDENG